MKKQSFIQGTMILLGAGIINRILGFIPRIALPRIIGAEGVGIYQLGYPFFLVMMTLITGGIPLGVAKLVSEAEGSGKPHTSTVILRVSLALTLGLGVIFMILCLLLAPWITSVILTDQRVYHTFVSMSPMIVIVAASSVYRGYFQGKQNMIPSAASSIGETLVRIICVLWFSYLLLPKGIAFGAAGAMLGVMAGELIGLLILLWQYQREQGQLQREMTSTDQEEHVSRRQTLRRLMRITIPVTSGRLVGSTSYLLESIITAQSLALAGFAASIATAQYGALQGMIIPLLLLPGAITSSLAVSLVPSLSESAARGDTRTIHKRLNQTLRLALVTGAPFAVMMYVLAEPICRLLYNNSDIAGMLQLIAPFGLFIYVQAPLQAALQALDRPGKALFNTFVGAVIKLALIWYLVSQPEYGIYGAIIAIIANSVIVTLLHGLSVAKLVSYRFKLLDMIKIVGTMFITAAALQYIYNHLPLSQIAWLQFTVSVVLGILIYLLAILAMRLVSLEDMKRIFSKGRWAYFS